MNIEQYFADHPGSDVATPVVVRQADGRTQLRTLSSILYGAPPPEPLRRLRRRMADLIRTLTTSTQSVTREGLRAGGFSEQEIDAHYRRALRLSGVVRLEDAL